MTIELALALLGVEAVAVALFGAWRYGTPLNPLTLDSLYETLLTTIVSGIVAYALLPLASYSPEDMIGTAAMSALYLAASALPFAFRGSGPARAFGVVMRLLDLHWDGYGARIRSAQVAALLTAAAVCFVGLALFGGGGLLWLTDTRVAYLQFRTGAGFFWLLASWFLMTTLIAYLWSRRPTGTHLVLVLLLFATGAYFTGSKQVILAVIVTGVAYYQFRVRPMPASFIVVLGASLIAGFFVLLRFQSGMTLASFASYFEHFDVTTRFLSRFDEYGYQLGGGWLSELWFYVPRALYPGKPLEYGALLIPMRLFPGAYEQGYAPGFLGWSLSYLDFGWAGVLAAGLFRGLAQRAIYEHYLAHPRSFFAFIFMMQFCLWWVLAFATFPIVIVWGVAVGVLFRLVLVRRSPHAVPEEVAHALPRHS